MDVEKGWHRRHIQRIFERRNEERKRREMEQRYRPKFMGILWKRQEMKELEYSSKNIRVWVY